MNESAAAVGHVESSRANAISNVIAAIAKWPKTAMVNSIWPLVGICLVPRQWTRCTTWQRSVNESLPRTVTPPPYKPRQFVAINRPLVLRGPRKMRFGQQIDGTLLCMS
jgi:hypothetical protein